MCIKKYDRAEPELNYISKLILEQGVSIEDEISAFLTIPLLIVKVY